MCISDLLLKTYNLLLITYFCTMSQFQFSGQRMFPPVVLNLIIVNALVFFAQKTFSEQSLAINDLFALHSVQSVFFKFYQLVTYMFMHGSFEHLFFNMLILFMFGSSVENYIGSRKFLFYYFACGVGAALLHMVVLHFEMMPYYDMLRQFSPEEQQNLLNSSGTVFNSITVGASGAIYGCLLAFGFLFPDAIINLWFFVPIKAKWYVLILGAIEFFLGIRNSAGDTVAHFAHLGGAITGLIILLIWNKSKRKSF